MITYTQRLSETPKKSEYMLGNKLGLSWAEAKVRLTETMAIQAPKKTFESAGLKFASTKFPPKPSELLPFGVNFLGKRCCRKQQKFF